MNHEEILNRIKSMGEDVNGVKKKEVIEKYLYLLIHVHLHDVLYEANRYKYASYGFNKCRQGALVSKDVLQKLMPEYDWDICVASCSDAFGAYEHAFAYGDKKNEEGGLLVDLTRVMYPTVFQEVKEPSYKDIPGFAGLRITKKEWIGTKWDKEREYFTHLSSPDFLNKVYAGVYIPTTAI